VASLLAFIGFVLAAVLLGVIGRIHRLSFVQQWSGETPVAFCLAFGSAPLTMGGIYLIKRSGKLGAQQKPR